MTTASAPLDGLYFDGKSSRAHRVTLALLDGIVSLSGEAERYCPLAQLDLSERSRHAARKLGFPDGACFEADDGAALSALLAAHGQRDGLVVRLLQSWRAVLAATLATVAVLALAYRFGLPLLAEKVADAMPSSVEQRLGKEVLATLDRHLLAPSTLPAARQQRLAAAFAALRAPYAGAPRYRLLFRKSRIGPNAFALPSGDIVMTDELVRKLQDEGAVIAVLAHELGHLHRRHMTRRLVHDAVVGAAGAVLFGDVSGLAAGASAMLLDMRHSREAEGEADDYAAEMLVQNGLPLAHLEHVFDVFTRLSADGPGYLSSHPPSKERLARVRERMAR